VRWLQAPLYIGLIVVQGLYVWQFWHERVGLLQKMAISNISETEIMLIVLGLIDVVMISNLLVMVTAFTERLTHPPEKAHHRFVAEEL
jgi:uncharacterized protein (TIGR00645 family)